METIKINDDYRLRVEHDHDAESPLQWGHGVYVESFAVGSWHMLGDHESHALRILCEVFRRTGDRMKAIQITARLVGVYEVDTDVKYLALYRHPDGYTVVLAGPDKDTAEWVWENYKTWARGDVYGVEAQARKVYRAENDPDDIMEVWETVDSIYGNYLDDEYTAKDVARDHFDSFPED